MEDVVVLVETKQNFAKVDEEQIAEYLAEERVLHYGKKIIAILANTNDDKIKVWKSSVDFYLMRLFLIKWNIMQNFLV